MPTDDEPASYDAPMAEDPPSLTWVVLTMGNRPDELAASLRSLANETQPATEIIVVVNDPDAHVEVPEGVRVERQTSNLGIPGGRDVGLRLSRSEFVGFLDDDAQLVGPAQDIVDLFRAEPEVGVVALRLVDEIGETSRRHVPRPGSAGVDRSGVVGTFLGGACAIRRNAYFDVGGYFTDLMYGHEELELSWRMVDNGWSIYYLAPVCVFHPRTEVGRHAHGWRLTGRNRVLIARRTLPIPVMVLHTVFWLVLGAARAPKGAVRRAYVASWWHAWRLPVRRQPIRWRSVWTLGRIGRLPVI